MMSDPAGSTDLSLPNSLAGMASVLRVAQIHAAPDALSNVNTVAPVTNAGLADSMAPNPGASWQVSTVPGERSIRHHPLFARVGGLGGKAAGHMVMARGPAMTQASRCRAVTAQVILTPGMEHQSLCAPCRLPDSLIAVHANPTK